MSFNAMSKRSEEGEEKCQEKGLQRIKVEKIIRKCKGKGYVFMPSNDIKRKSERREYQKRQKNIKKKPSRE